MEAITRTSSMASGHGGAGVGHDDGGTAAVHAHGAL
jgi:hypothetical protein